MKKIFFLLAAMAMTFGAKAQIVESSAKTIKVEAAKPKSGYNRIMFNYSPLFTSIKFNETKLEGDGAGKTLQGGSISYTRGISVSKRLPMFVEVGIGAQFNSGNVIDGYTTDYDRLKLGLTLVRANIPVAFTYRFGFGQNKRIKISPFTGFNFGINIVTDDDKKYNYDILNYYNYKDDNYNRFQMGWLIGANFTFKRFNIQIAYTFDFMPLYKQEAQTVVYNSYYDSYYGWTYDYVTIPETKINTGVLTVGLGWEF